MDILEFVNIKKIYENAILPVYSSEYASGLDLYSCNIDPIILDPNDIKLISTGISIALPIGYEAQIRPRSGLAIKYGITVLNSPGTIDSDYRGEIKVILINNGKNKYIIENGMRIAQMVISKYSKINKWNEVIDHDDTIRGENGFGSTGI